MYLSVLFLGVGDANREDDQEEFDEINAERRLY